ncbi:MAG: DUF1559 domain-containing protein, partial [Pirellulaceae bacterium]
FVHWLASRMRLAQEFAADEVAAAESGDRKTYIQCLAMIALGDHSKRRASLAPLFLPNESSVIRRVKMLNKPFVPSRTVPTWLVVSAMLLTAISVMGIRNVNSTAEKPFVATMNPSIVQESSEASLDFVPDSGYVMIFRPAKLLGNPVLEQAREKFPYIERQLSSIRSQVKSRTGLELEQIDQITFCASPSGLGAVKQYWVIRAIEDSEEEFRKANGSISKQVMPNGEEKELVIFQGKRSPWGNYGRIVDSKTLLTSQQAVNIQYAEKIGEKQAKNAKWYSNWEHVSNDGVVLLASGELIREVVEALQLETTFPFIEKADSVRDAKSLVASIDVLDEVEFLASFECSDKESANKAIAAGEEVMASLKPMLDMLQFQSQTNAVEELYAKLWLEIVSNIRFEQSGVDATVSSRLQIDVEALGEIAESVTQAANITETKNRMRQLALMMHTYHDANGHFPSPVLISDQGKPYSWRIAVLRFLGEETIYRKYRFDEDWDSEHNLAVTSKMPDVFRHPLSNEENETHFLTIVGPESINAPAEGAELMQIADGSSQTLLLLEAKKAVHWAKPEDLSFDDACVVSNLGGTDDAGFVGILANGAALLFNKSILKEDLRSILTAAGGEAVTDADIQEWTLKK